MRALTVLTVLLGLASGCDDGAPDARLVRGGCPDRMAQIGDTDACIDRYEGVISGGGDALRVTPARGRVPTGAVSWSAAREACRASGFRLCTAAEWEHACSGVPQGEEGGRGFPYGDEFVDNRCNSTPTGERAVGREVARGGSHPECVTPEGVFDLSGNLAEWVEDGVGPTREMRGGSFSDLERYVHCANDRISLHPLEFESSGFGVRCCADAG